MEKLATTVIYDNLNTNISPKVARSSVILKRYLESKQNLHEKKIALEKVLKSVEKYEKDTKLSEKNLINNIQQNNNNTNNTNEIIPSKPIVENKIKVEQFVKTDFNSCDTQNKNNDCNKNEQSTSKLKKNEQVVNKIEQNNNKCEQNKNQLKNKNELKLNANTKKIESKKNEHKTYELKNNNKNELKTKYEGKMYTFDNHDNNEIDNTKLVKYSKKQNNNIKELFLIPETKWKESIDEIANAKQLKTEIEINRESIIETENKVDKILQMLEFEGDDTLSSRKLNSPRKQIQYVNDSITTNNSENQNQKISYNFYVFLTLILAEISVSILQTTDFLLGSIKNLIDKYLLKAWKYMQKFFVGSRSNSDQNLLKFLVFVPVIIIVLVLYTSFCILYFGNHLLLTSVPKNCFYFVDLQKIKKISL